MRRIAAAAMLVCVAWLGMPSGTSAQDQPTLSIAAGGRSAMATRSELWQRADRILVHLPEDVAYGRPMAFQVVPLAALLGGFDLTSADVLEVVAADGKTAILPLDLVLSTEPGVAQAFLAIEPEDRPWPPLPGSKASAGPFYVVWRRPEASGVRSDQWPHQVVRIAAAQSPVRRWPVIAVDPTLPANHPARAGLDVFVVQCMACHTMNGAGTAAIGPDLNLPLNPVEYLADGMLARLIRDPASVRAWGGMQMKPHLPTALADRDLALVVAYLRHMASRKVIRE